MKSGYVYIMTNRKHGTLYIGVTSDLSRRIYDHRQGTIAGFTKRYGLKQLVYYECGDDILAAIQREKRLKKYPRQWKINLIESVNPDWKDLYAEITGWPGQAGP